MTFVGKILVLLIMAMSLIFLGVSTVVFTTSTNWKTEMAKQSEQVKKLQVDLKSAKDSEGDAQRRFDESKKEHDQATKGYEGQIATLTGDNKKAQDEITAVRTQLTDAQANSNLALAEVEARRKDVSGIRDQLTAVTDQANKFKIQQTELNTEILTLKRMLDAAERNAKDLRETTWKFATRLQKAGLSTDVSGMAANEPAPDVEGKVLKVDDRNRRLEISLGSNDGLAAGQELFLFRTSPVGEFLGKVRIIATDPKQSVAEVINKTVNGKKIKEGDDVASSIRSR